MKEFDPYIRCPWCGIEIHQNEYLDNTHMCPKREAAYRYLDLQKIMEKYTEYTPPKRTSEWWRSAAGE